MNHTVSLSRECFTELKNSLPPQSRFINADEWKFNHVWLYDPNGDVLIFRTSESGAEK